MLDKGIIERIVLDYKDIYKQVRYKYQPNLTAFFFTEFKELFETIFLLFSSTRYFQLYTGIMLLMDDNFILSSDQSV
jgi:hypothetical protein